MLSIDQNQEYTVLLYPQLLEPCGRRCAVDPTRGELNVPNTARHTHTHTERERGCAYLSSSRPPARSAVRRPSAGDRPATGRPPGARPRAGARDRLTTDHTSGSAPPETHTRVARCRVPTARCAREPRVCTANPNGCARPSASLDVWRAPHRRKMVDAKLLTASSSRSFGLSYKQ